jgi:transcriptional regulator with XRE-family HTH domain
MMDYTEYSATELVKVLGVRFKDYRLRAQLTQKDVAELTGLTVPTIQRFENGLSGNITLGTFLLLMKAVGCINGLDELMPDQPESPYLYKDNNKKAQRVRHKNFNL